jgi:hypothetical protein
MKRWCALLFVVLAAAVPALADTPPRLDLDDKTIGE